MIPSWRCWWCKLCSASSLAIAGAIIAASGNCALAQITPDVTLGAESSQVTSPTPGAFQIDGGATRDTNLFHSFEQFSVLTGGVAHFNSAPDIQNIISRVTGGSISNIDGLIRANGTANLFLLNPNGIVFGPNARLSIGGSFLGSTASAVNFADGTQFSATAHPTTPLLTVSVPIGLQFGGTAGSIRNQSREFVLQVQEGKTLALLGGDVELDGVGLLAPGGRVELGGVAGPGTVGLAVDDFSLSYPEGVQRADVSLTNQAIVSVAAGGGGSIAVNARNLDILGESGLLAGIESGLGSVDSQAGNITLNATGTITIAGINNEFISAIYNNVDSGAVGKGGDINILTRSLFLNNAFLSASTRGQGDAGSIYVRATDSVSVANSLIYNLIGEEAGGKGGDINIQARSLSLTDGANIATTTLGHGDAGRVLIQADDSVSVITNSFIQSAVSTGAVGKGGDINIQARSLFLTDNASLNASTFGRGDAGSVFVQADDSVSLVNSKISSAVEENAVGKGGSINIQARLLSLTDNSVEVSTALSTSTSGQGNAGNVLIHASDSVSLVNSDIFSSNTGDLYADGEVAVGNAGDINILTGALSLSDNAYVSTDTYGQGDAGSVFIHATGSVSLTSNSSITSNVTSSAFIGIVGPEAVGKGGDINIQAQSLSFNNALLSTTTAGQGNAGGIFVHTNDSVSLTSDSIITSSVERGGVGNGGDIDIQTHEISLTDGSQIRAAIEPELDNLPGGQGKGGNIRISATANVNLSGVATDGTSSGLSTTTGRGASGQAGDITVNTGAFRIADGGFVSARTQNPSDGGNITINANAFEAANGGQVLTTTSNRGQAGDITVNATDSVTLSGTDPTFPNRLAQFGKDVVSNEGSASGLFAGTSGAGTAGDLKIATGQLIVRDGAFVSVSSVGLEPGNAGNLEIQARSILLENYGKLIAETASGQGGNITLKDLDLLLLRRNSQISTTAGTAQAGGDGGNIDIDTQFLVTVPGENSDITANAFQGRGGNVRITTQGIFGIQLRDRQTPLSDITASSEFGVSGVVEINTIDVDPSLGLVTLPAELVEASRLIATGCAADGENKFIATGRGGLPPNPGAPLNGEAVLTEWATLDPEVESRSGAASSTNLTRERAITPIVEAQGWVINNKGEVVLTALAPNVTSTIPWMNPATCHTP